MRIIMEIKGDYMGNGGKFIIISNHNYKGLDNYRFESCILDLGVTKHYLINDGMVKLNDNGNIEVWGVSIWLSDNEYLKKYKI